MEYDILSRLYGVSSMPIEVSYDIPNNKEYHFIYGTLRKGNRNHSMLIPSDMELVRDNHILNDYGFVTPFHNTPAIIPLEGNNVCGDIYLMGKDNQGIIELVEQGYKRITVFLWLIGSCIDVITYVWPDNSLNIKATYSSRLNWRE